MTSPWYFAAGLAVSMTIISSATAQPAATPPAAAMEAIRQIDLTRDLTLLGGDGMRGREAGTIDELKASVWVAEQLRAIGVEPMGDAGSYFQWFNLRRTRIGASSLVRVGTRDLVMWRDVAVTGTTPADVSGSTVWAGDGRDTTVDVRGKIALAQLVSPPAGGRQTSVNSPEYRYARSAMQSLGFALTRRGATAVMLIADSTAQIAFDGISNIGSRGGYILGRIAGTDAQLREEYVLFSSHQDHEGVRYDVAGDSIWNGADDNGTTYRSFCD